MNTNNHLPKLAILGVLCLAVGVLLGTLLFGGITWAGLEATFYGFAKYSSEPLGTLRCPLLVTTSETATVSADFTNPSDRSVTILVRTDTSSPGAARREQALRAFQPAETIHVERTISAANMDLGNFIFVKAYQYPSYKSGMKEAVCGILVVAAPFVNGALLFAVWFGASLVCLCLGLFLWLRYAPQYTQHQADTTRALKTIALMVMVGMFFSFQGNWLVGILMLAVILLMLAVGLYFFLAR
jgi:hypothetical protein